MSGVQRLEQAVLGSVVAPIAQVDPPNEGDQLAHRAGLRSLLLLLVVQVDVHKLLQVTRSGLSDLSLRQLDTLATKQLAVAGCQSGQRMSSSQQQEGQGAVGWGGGAAVWWPLEPVVAAKGHSTVSLQRPFAQCLLHNWHSSTRQHMCLQVRPTGLLHYHLPLYDSVPVLRQSPAELSIAS